MTGRAECVSIIAGKHAANSTGSPCLDYLRGNITMQNVTVIWREWGRQRGIETSQDDIPARTDWRYCRPVLA